MIWLIVALIWLFLLFCVWGFIFCAAKNDMEYIRDLPTAQPGITQGEQQ